MIAAHYRVSRYAPGCELDDTWTGQHDVGSSFDGVELTEQDYRAVENRYLYAHSVFMQQSGVSTVVVLDLQVGTTAPERWHALSEGDEIGGEDATELLRAMLREQVNAKLEVPDTYYLHTGYDMFTYVGTPQPVPVAVDEARSIGLFVDDDVPSPYLPDPTERFWWLVDGRPVRHRVSSFDRTSGRPLEWWDVPDADLPTVFEVVPCKSDDPDHWDAYELTGDQSARVLPLLGAAADPDREYTLVSYNP